MAIRGYNENESPDDTPSVDADSNQITEREVAPALAKYRTLLRWSEEKRGAPFLRHAILKQYKAFQMARTNNLTPRQMKDRWEEMEDDKFWSSKGFDWMDVLNNLGKKPPVT